VHEGKSDWLVAAAVELAPDQRSQDVDVRHSDSLLDFALPTPPIFRYGAADFFLLSL
jgi:hypothetical protein